VEGLVFDVKISEIETTWVRKRPFCIFESHFGGWKRRTLNLRWLGPLARKRLRLHGLLGITRPGKHLQKTMERSTILNS
jgi:hypothetical protein